MNNELKAIPKEFRCDPFEISPSGDPFFADKRNVEYLDRIIEEAHNNQDEPPIVLRTSEDIKRFLGVD